MNVILLEKIHNLGNLGDETTVRAGYARNYLLPQGKAILATESNRKHFAVRRAALEKTANDLLSAARASADKLEQASFTIAARAREGGKLYGAVGVREIVKAIAEHGVELQKRQVLLPDGPIHAIGEYQVGVQLHSDVRIQVQVIVISV